MSDLTTPEIQGAQPAPQGQFRKRPVVIEAVQYTQAVRDAHLFDRQPLPEGVEIPRKHLHPGDRVVYNADAYIQTLEGRMSVSLDDWIITGVKGERYACKPDIFAMTYESAAIPAPEGGPQPETQMTADEWRKYLDQRRQWEKEQASKEPLQNLLTTAAPAQCAAEGDADPSYADIRALIANLQRLEDPAQTELPTLDGVDGRALVGKCWRGLDWLLGEVDALEVAKDEAERAPWPDWANQVLKVVREFSGYDGYDDADGVDIAEEVGECLRELAADAKRARDALAASQVQPKGTTAATAVPTIPRLLRLQPDAKAALAALERVACQQNSHANDDLFGIVREFLLSTADLAVQAPAPGDES